MFEDAKPDDKINMTVREFTKAIADTRREALEAAAKAVSAAIDEDYLTSRGAAEVILALLETESEVGSKKLMPLRTQQEDRVLRAARPECPK